MLKKKISIFFFQYTGNGRVLASIHQQRSQRRQVQESGGLGGRLIQHRLPEICFLFSSSIITVLCAYTISYF